MKFVTLLTHRINYRTVPYLYFGLLELRHRAINIFLRTYQELWLSDENVGQEVIIEDLTVSSENHNLLRRFVY